MTPTAPSATAAVPQHREAGPAAWYALGVLTLITLFAFVDRGVLVLQAEVIRQKLGLSDLQLGLLQGTGVAVFAALASYPLGWLADRYDRRLVLAGCVVFWSSAVVACGLAQGYEQLLLASALVGAGEAGLVPIVYALIPELFGQKKQQLANSIYSLSSTASGAAALALCGAIIGSVELARPMLPAAMQALEGWRLSFFAAALPAPLMVLAIVSISLRKRRAGRALGVQPAPTRVATAATGAQRPPTIPAMAPGWLAYARQQWQAFACFYAGVGLAMFGFAAVGSWLAVIYMRVFGQTAQQVGAALGGIALTGTALGFGLSVFGMRFLSPRLGVRTPLRAMWVACLSTVATYSMMVFATSAQQMFVIQGLYVLLLTTAVMLYPTALQNLAPSALRARTVALMGVMAAGMGAIASPLVGLVSDQFKHLPNGLILSAVLVAAPALLVAAVLLFLCERRFVATVEAAQAADRAADGA